MPAPSTPLYFRIQETLRAQIAAGRFGEAGRLPSETELAQAYDTTRTTVRQALAQLTFEGLIVRRMGLGTFVSSAQVESRIEAQRPQSFEEQMEAAGAHIAFRLLGFDAEPANAAVAATLRLAPGEPVYRLRRLRLVDDQVIGLEDRFMLMRLGAAVPAAALATLSAVALVEAAIGAPLGGMTVTVGVQAVEGETARHLGMRRGSPVLMRVHTFFDPETRPILTGESVYRGDKYRFTYRFGQVDA